MQAHALKLKKTRLLRDALILIFSIFVAVYIQKLARAEHLIGYFSVWYYSVLAAFLTGLMFSVTFSVAISTSIFLLLGDTSVNPLLIALVGGLGSVAGNSIIYKFFKDDLMADISSLEPQYAKRITHNILHSKLFIGLVPYVAALLLASPLPDEIGIFMLAGTKLKYTNFFLLSFALHSIGILIIVLLGDIT